MIKNIGIKFESSLIITTVASSIYKSYMLCSYIPYFRLLKTADLEDGVRRRIAEQRSRPAELGEPKFQSRMKELIVESWFGEISWIKEIS